MKAAETTIFQLKLERVTSSFEFSIYGKNKVKPNNTKIMTEI